MTDGTIVVEVICGTTHESSFDQCLFQKIEAGGNRAVNKTDTRKAIRMTQAEAWDWLEKGDNCSLATIDHNGYPHLVAMAYGLDGGDIVMTSFAKAQKVVNLRRNRRAAIMVESGKAYSSLKGVMVRGQAEIIDNTEKVLQVLNLVGRRTLQVNKGARPQTDGPVVINEQITQQARRLAAKRVVIRLHPEKLASWDHSKLPPGKY
jgi:nitroimidazol reductase NimA-like FMN-containing flavoprotein (pyridoxamine 5'-phosphate oxidase superfamily)